MKFLNTVIFAFNRYQRNIKPRKTQQEKRKHAKQDFSGGRNS